MSTDRHDGQWWTDDNKAERGQRVYDVVRAIWQENAQRREQMLVNARLYGEINLASLTPRAHRQATSAGAKSRHCTFNGTASLVDTLVALVTKSDVKITCQTTGASWEQRQRAATLQEFLDGAREEAGWEEVSQEIAYHVAKWNPGWAHFFEDDSDPEDIKLGCEPVLPWEVLEDQQDAAYRKPQSRYRIKFRDRAVLQVEYPELARELETANAEGFGDTAPGYSGTGVDLVPVIAAWHLPRYRPSAERRDADDTESPEAEAAGETAEPNSRVEGGRYVLCVGRLVLEDEPYDDLTFPLEPCYLKRPTTGTYGEGAPEAVSGMQRELNVLGAKIQRCEHLMGVPHWLVPREGKVNTNKIDNAIGSMIEYSNGEQGRPTPVVGPAVPPELFAREDKILFRMGSLYGIPPELLQGSTPDTSPDTSGEARRVALTAASDRFKPVMREWRGFHLRAARQFVRLAHRIAARRPDFFVRRRAEDMTKTIAWADAGMEDSEYVLRLTPTNSAADDPEGVIDELQDWVNAGTIPQDDGLRLIAATGNRPDLKAYLQERYASREAAMQSISAILDGGEYMPPNEMMNLAECTQLGQAHYLLAASHGCPRARLDELARWLVQVDDLQPKAAPPPAPGAPGAPPPKPGGPMALSAQMAPPPPPALG